MKQLCPVHVTEDLCEEALMSYHPLLKTLNLYTGIVKLIIPGEGCCGYRKS